MPGSSGGGGGGGNGASSSGRGGSAGGGGGGGGGARVEISYCYRAPSSLRPVFGEEGARDKERLYSEAEVAAALGAYAAAQGGLGQGWANPWAAGGLACTAAEHPSCVPQTGAPASAAAGPAPAAAAAAQLWPAAERRP